MTEQVVEQYYATCFHGHVMEVKHDTALEAKCVDREQKHPERISALVLDPSDCPGCWSYARRSFGFYLDAVADWEICPTHNQHGYLCKSSCCYQQDCPAQRAPAEGEYLGQSRLLPED